jgi:YhcH/YjgK/YiaL family protein
MLVIVDKTENLWRYASLFPNSEALAEFFKASQLKEGETVSLPGFEFSPFRFNSEPSDGKKWEIHRRHIDIHAAVSGREAIEWIPASLLKKPIEYNAELDVEFFSDTSKGTTLVLEEGWFAFLEPFDAHKPSVKADGVDGGVKAVVKADAL